MLHLSEKAMPMKHDLLEEVEAVAYYMTTWEESQMCYTYTHGHSRVNAAHGHGCTVLLLDSSQVGVVHPLQRSNSTCTQHSNESATEGGSCPHDTIIALLHAQTYSYMSTCTLMHIPIYECKRISTGIALPQVCSILATMITTPARSITSQHSTASATHLHCLAAVACWLADVIAV
jgi:hypothetical protein